MIACLFSGGKDSTLALHKVADLGIGIDLLITMMPESKESYMFHYPNLSFTKLQAEALGIRQVFAATKGVKEKELKDLEKALLNNKITLLVTGATYSKYQGDRIAAIAKRNGIENVAPLWHINPMLELSELVEKFDVIMTSVSAEGLDASFLGKRIDRKMVDRLLEVNKKTGINLLFEGGEAETFVLDAPLFKKKIKVEKAHIESTGINASFIIEKASLVSKRI